MVTITHTAVTREHVWAAFRRAHDVRVRARYHSILLLMDGKNWPEVAQWLYRDEDRLSGRRAAGQESGALWRGSPGAHPS